MSEDRRLWAMAVGVGIGVLGTLLAVLIVELGFIITFALVGAVLVGLYVLTSLDAALIVLMATAALLPYGTLPFKIGFTPSLIECALGGVLLVYLFQWMTGRRRDFRFTPMSGLIIGLVLFMSFAFFLGLRGGMPTPNQLKTFASLMLCMVLAVLLVDIAANIQTLRRLTFVLLLVGAVAGLIGVMLWFLPNTTAEQILNRLGRIGYPVGGVIRYREDGVNIGVERAIGTWIDPNAYAGFLLMMGGLGGAQLFSKQPVTRWRWLAFILFGCIALALFLSDSRGAAIGLVLGLGLIAVLRDRRLMYLGAIGGGISLFLPPTQRFIERILLASQAGDLETQMRLGEYKDALILINRHPIFGVGFTGVPEIDLYVAFSSTYLTIAAYAGLVGLIFYLVTIGGVLGWGFRWWGQIKVDPRLSDVWLGLLAGIMGALFGGIFDHFYFNPQFQATALIFWSYIGLFLATTRLAQEGHESSSAGAKPAEVKQP